MNDSGRADRRSGPPAFRPAVYVPVDTSTLPSEEESLKACYREGEALRRRRISLGLTQHAAADRAGMSLQQYQRYEYGKRTMFNSPMHMGLQICEALGIDPRIFRE